MKILAILASAVACAGLAGVASNYICERYVRWFHLSQRGGSAAYFVFAVVLLGSGTGLVVGLLSGALAPTFTTALVVDAAAVLAVAGPVCAVLYARGDVAPRDRGESLDLALEVRAPAGIRLTNAMRAHGGYATMCRVRRDGKNPYASYNSGSWRPGEDGRLTVFLTLGVFTAKGPWRVEFEPGDKSRICFPDFLPGAVRAAAAWSSWIESPEGYAMRYRLVTSSESRRLQAEAAEAARAGEAAGRNTTMPSSTAPLEDWVQFLGSSECTGDLRLEALGIIRSRHAEVIRLLEGARPEALEAPLHVVSLYYQMPRSFEGPLRGLLQRLTDAVLEYRRTSPVDDPDILGARALRQSFTRWASAWDVLLTCWPDAAEPDFAPLIEAASGARESDPIHEIARAAASYRDHALRN